MENKLNLPPKSDLKSILKLDGTKLPSFPQVAAKLMKMSKDKSASLQDLSKVVETDPGISARVLEIVNSAMYGLKRKVTKLSEAVVFLGLDEIKKLSLGMTVFEKIFKKGNHSQFDRLLFWRHSLSVAVLSMEIAKETGYPDPEEAYIAGLLHDVGKIFLDLQGKVDYGQFIESLSKTDDLIIEQERSTIGLGHDDVGAFFASMWKLPEKLILAIKYHHQPFEHIDLDPQEMMLISIVSMANFLCWTQGTGSFNFIRPPVLPPEVSHTIPPEQINISGCIHNMNVELEKISEFYQFVFPSPEEVKDNLLWASLKLSNANTRYYYHERPQIETASPSEEDQLPFDVSIELGKPLAKAKTVKEVLDIVMYQVGCIFQPLHWSILLKNPKTSEMVFSVVVGSNKEKLQGVKLPPGEGIAGHIMETGESVIVEDVTQDKRFSKRVDNYSGFTTQSVIGTPLKTDEKIFGVIELINRISDDNFSEQDLKILTSIAEYAAIAVERAYYNQALATLATKDSLTGLKNRLSFDKLISNKDSILRRFGTTFSLLVVQFEAYERILEANGIEACDDEVQFIGSILSKTKRHEDELFRYADDTFIIMLPHTFSEGAQEARHRILKTYSTETTQNDRTPQKIAISPQTIGAGEIKQLKNLIQKKFSKSNTLENTESGINQFQENLQPLIESENKSSKQTPETVAEKGKTVSLGGEYVRLKTHETGHIKIEQLSLTFAGFRIAKSHRIQVNDFLDIQFPLDDINRSLIKRRVVVREIKGNYIHADFYNPPPYAKQLGFYLMS